MTTAMASRGNGTEASAKIGPLLVTGSNGFLGRALTRQLTAMGETVIALDIGQSDSTAMRQADDSQTGQTIFCEGDIRDADTVRMVAERHEVRAIVHLAAPNIPACKERPAEGAEIIITGHVNVLEAARHLGIRKVLYTSSIAARPRGPLDTQSNLYGAYKHCCEHISKIYFLDYGIASIGLRPNVVYGPGRESGETSAITMAMKAAANGASYAMPFGGHMSFQHVDEVMDILVRCLTVDATQPVISDLSTETHSIDDVIAAIRTVRPDARIARSSQERPAPPGLDNGPLVALLGSWARVSLAEGARRTIEHYASRLTGTPDPRGASADPKNHMSKGVDR